MQSKIPTVTSVAEQLSECLDTQILGVVWHHNLAKYLTEFVSKLSELKAKLGLHRNPFMLGIMGYSDLKLKSPFRGLLIV